MNLRRRHFLMGSGLAAHSAFSQTAGERIPTAMIGTGNRGSYVLKGVLEQPGAKVAALCDLKPSQVGRCGDPCRKGQSGYLHGMAQDY